jgi:predicted nucleotidyltransferase
MTAPRLFSGDELRDLLNELGDRIQRRGESVDAYIIGGTAMAIGLASRRATEDIDGLFRPFEVVKEEAAVMAHERELPPGWINQSAFSFMSFELDDTDARVIEIGGMHVRLASPRFLLAMKMAAGRLKDHDDIVTLIRHLGITHPQEIVDLTFEIFGENGVTLTDSRESVLLQAEEMVRLAR